MYRYHPAILALEDGSIFQGSAFQAEGIACGEVVFNTAMTGYQEILTDCSYAGQMVTFTYPHIGNVGTNAFDAESGRIWPRGMIVRSLSFFPSNWRSQEALPEYLLKQECLVIGDVDTRALTQKIQSLGALKGCIMVGNIDPARAIQLARNYNDIETQDLSKLVSTLEAYHWTEGSNSGSDKNGRPQSLTSNPHVVVYDYGVKRSILRCLVDLGCKVTVVPATTSIYEIEALLPDGVLLSNGPGNPELCTDAIQKIKTLVDHPSRIPLLGICLGHQLLTLAFGGKTTKMKFGHHGANHPVQDLKTGRVLITSQNHSFMTEESSLPPDVEITHRSLFDSTPQGIKHLSKPIWGFQGHPEASPGPIDAKCIFSGFIQAVQNFQKTKQSARDVAYV